MVVQTGTQGGVTQPAQYKKWIETWSLSFTFPASTAAGTQIFGSINRTPGSPGSISLSTSTTPFYLPPSQSGVIVDAYINSLQSGLNGSAYLNFYVNDQDQRLAIDIASYNSTIAGRKAIVAKALPAGCQFRASLVNQAGTVSTGATTQLVLLDVEMFQ